MRIRVQNGEYNLELTIDVTDKTIITLGLLDLCLLTYQAAWRLISGTITEKQIAEAWIFALKSALRSLLTSQLTGTTGASDLTETLTQRLMLPQIEREKQQLQSLNPSL